MPEPIENNIFDQRNHFVVNDRNRDGKKLCQKFVTQANAEKIINSIFERS